MTGNKSLRTYKRAEIVKIIKQEVATVRSGYDLVRLENLIIADEDNKEAVAEMILELNEFSNVSRKMTPGQIIETVNMLLSGYPRLSLQEYQIFFNRIKNGYYGQLYESLDGIKIMAFMKEYYQEILRAYNEYKEENHQQIKLMEQHRDL